MKNVTHDRLKRTATATLGAMLLLGGSGAAHAQTTPDQQALLAQVSALQSSLGSGQLAAVAFSRDLTLGSTGADVTALQTWLMSKGYAIPAGATGRFGAQTAAALRTYQAASGITPASGYFGPLTRARVNASSIPATPATPSTPATGTTTAPASGLSGGEASLRRFDLRTERAIANEGDTRVAFATATFDVSGSDVNVQRTQLTFKPQTISGINSKPWQFFDKVYVMNGSTVVGSADASSRSAWDDNGSGTNETYTIHINNLSTVVKDGNTAGLTFAADISNGIDSADMAQKFTVGVPSQGIRAVDAKGIQQYVGNGSDTISISFGAEQNGDLSIRESASDPEASILVADKNKTSGAYTVFAFDLRNKQDASAQLDQLSFNVNSLTAGVQASDIIQTASLSIGGKSYSGTVGSSTILFKRLNARADGNATVPGTLTVKLARNATSTPVSFSLSGTDIDAEGVTTGKSTAVSGTQSSAVHTIALAGIALAPKSATATETSTQSGADFGTYTVKFTVSAIEEDAYIAATAATSTPAGVTYDIGGSTFAGTNNATLTSGARLDNGYYKVSQGSTETFTLTVVLDPSTSGTYFVRLASVAFNDHAAAGTATYTVDDSKGAYRTDPVYIPQ